MNRGVFIFIFLMHKENTLLNCSPLCPFHMYFLLTITVHLIILLYYHEEELIFLIGP